MDTRYLVFFDTASGRSLRTSIPASTVNLVGGQLRDDVGQVIAIKSRDGHHWVLKRPGNPDFVGAVFDDYRFE